MLGNNRLVRKILGGKTKKNLLPRNSTHRETPTERIETVLEEVKVKSSKFKIKPKPKKEDFKELTPQDIVWESQIR